MKCFTLYHPCDFILQFSLGYYNKIGIAFIFVIFHNFEYQFVILLNLLLADKKISSCDHQQLKHSYHECKIAYTVKPTLWNSQFTTKYYSKKGGYPIIRDYFDTPIMSGSLKIDCIRWDILLNDIPLSRFDKKKCKRNKIK